MPSSVRRGFVFQVERGSRAVGVAGAARSRRRGHGPARRAKRTLDVLGTSRRLPTGGRRSKRSAARPAPLTTEGDSLPFPAGRGRGDGRVLLALDGLLQAKRVGLLPFIDWLGPRFAGEHEVRGVQRSETPGDAGWEREARAEGRRPGGAGGAKPQEAVRGLT